MDNNEFNRRLRYALRLDDHETLRLTLLGGVTPSLDDVRAWRTKEQEDGFQKCPTQMLYSLLSGLILDRRGPPPDTKSASEQSGADRNSQQADSHQTPKKSLGDEQNPNAKKIDNNWVIKQLRIALSLRTDDVHELITQGGGKLGKTEVNAFFRKPDARNYRRCGDQVVRWFLNGLSKRRRD